MCNSNVYCRKSFCMTITYNLIFYKKKILKKKNGSSNSKLKQITKIIKNVCMFLKKWNTWFLFTFSFFPDACVKSEKFFQAQLSLSQQPDFFLLLINDGNKNKQKHLLLSSFELNPLWKKEMLFIIQCLFWDWLAETVQLWPS